jgi:hypothetical protein
MAALAIQLGEIMTELSPLRVDPVQFEATTGASMLLQGQLAEEA